jgi:predicted metallopeptidase
MAKKKQNQPQAIPIQFDPAEEVEKIAKRLIPKYHSHLVNSKIAYLFKNKEMKSKGRLIVATAKKISKEMTTLSGYNFLIVVSYPTFRDLNDDQKLAVIDHELEHCFVDEDPKTGDPVYSILPHDVEEFSSIIRRHGLYTTDLVKVGMVIEDVLPASIKKDLVVTKLGKPIQANSDPDDQVDDLTDDEFDEPDDNLLADEQDFI